MNFFQNNIRTIAPKGAFFGNFLLIGVVIAFVALLILFVQYLVVHVWCLVKPANNYEHFEGTQAVTYLDKLNANIASVKATGNTIQKKTQELQKLQTMIERDLEALDDTADAACEITKNIEDNYISSNAAPTDEIDASLPQKTREVRQQKRSQRAKARFEKDKTTFAALKNVPPLYECFAIQDEEKVRIAEEREQDAQKINEANETLEAETSKIKDYENDLRSEIVEVERIIDTAQMRAAAAKGQALESLMMFNDKYLKQSSALTEGFANMLTGKALLDRADELIQKGNNLHQEVLDISAAVRKQQSQSAAIFKKGNAVMNGDVTAVDAAKAAKVRKD